MPNENKENKMTRVFKAMNRHTKAAVANRSRKNLAAKLASLRPAGNAVYQTMNTNSNNKNKNSTKKNCGPKPTKVWKNSKTKTNEFLQWNACTKAAAAAGGGRRKTRKGKKSRRMTRRR